jgi:hypothetical protein
MKQIIKAIFITLVTAFSLGAQVPDNFEYLAHTYKENIISDVILEEDHLVFSSSQGLHKANYNYSYEDLISGNSFTTFKKHKLVKVSDSTYHFFFWGIEEADIPVLTGFEFYSFDRGVELYDRVGAFDLDYINEVTHDSIGGFWCLGAKSPTLNTTNTILHYGDQGLDSKIDFSFFDGKLFTNSVGDIFVYDPYISHFNGIEFMYSDTIIEKANDIVIWGENNLILDGSKIHLTTTDFMRRLHSWDLPVTINNLDNIKMNSDSSLYVVDLQSDQYNIYHIDAESSDSLLYTGYRIDSELLTGIKVLSDSTHLLFGQHLFEVTNNTFFRNIHHTTPLEYQKSNVDIQGFGIIPVDTIEFPIPVIEGEVVLDYQNNEDETIENLNAISTYYNNHNFLSSRRNLNIPLSSELVSQALIQDSGVIRYSTEDLSGNTQDITDIKIEIPGANYRFNTSLNRIRTLDFISRINDDLEENRIANLYPNPVSNYFDIKHSGYNRITILDNQGKLVRNQKLLGNQSRIWVSSLSTGVYYGVLSGEKIREQTVKIFIDGDK